MTNPRTAVCPRTVAASCKLAPGATGRYPCNGQMKLSAGLWPLQPAPQYQGGSIHAPHSQRVPEPGSVAEVLSAAPPNGVGFEQAKGKGVRQLCIWDAFGETWTNSTGGALPGQHRSIPEMWWEGFGRFLALKSDDDDAEQSDAPLVNLRLAFSVGCSASRGRMQAYRDFFAAMPGLRAITNVEVVPFAVNSAWTPQTPPTHNTIRL